MSILYGDRKKQPISGAYLRTGFIAGCITKKTASLVVVNGRRRVSKSRLLEEFARGHTFYAFVGLAPQEGMTAQDQRNAFALSF
jgi:hypothetical protein